ncbi:CamS family sex pheromone protein [Sporosarcina sp. PTS2304]|uniref:CamS family sex pheromone protein n=1 Tax=Sporosarcina sp. PTS2304 TaxID=2283194 RepID=UPI000E0DF83C|nr:CamS family sex pheromone protein [Sporosarcina sp. PTS2304]AXI00057.1 CamS family sex pheromone protein [Sporosarcina sp. PTS2304]
MKTMNKWFLPGLLLAFLLSGCVPSPTDDQEKALQESEENDQEMVIIPEEQIKKEYYRTPVPFKKSASKGLVVSNLNTKYDMAEVEEGLLRLSTQYFDTEKYFFQEGQYIDRDTAKEWISRKSNYEAGLNPAITDDMSPAQIAEQAPIYLAHIVEQNYLQMTDDKKVKLAGMTIGLAMNSVYYPREGNERSIDDKVIEEKGKQMADIILSRLRSKPELADIPIAIGLFKQNSRNDIVPGTYFATSFAGKGKNEFTGWKEVDETYVLLPATSSTGNYRDLNTTFKKFKQDIDDYFPSFVNVVGTAFYKDQKLKSLHVEIPIQFFGKSELISFSQYLTSLVKIHFEDVPIEVSVTSVNGPEVLIVDDGSRNEPLVHVYGY